MLYISMILFVLFVLDIIVIAVLSFRIQTLREQLCAQRSNDSRSDFVNSGKPSGQETQMRTERKAPTMRSEHSPLNGGDPVVPARIKIGTLQNQGRRPSQQDNSATSQANGTLAVVADGMGGLSGGDQVSQLVVKTMLSCVSRAAPDAMDGVLYEMVKYVVKEVNTMLGPSNLYKSGSTLVAVLVKKDRFHWISVGDSRIYFYRGGNLIQLNREHTYEQELLQRLVNGEIDFNVLNANPDKTRLTSFIGMGDLKYIDGSRRSIALVPGDRILLMSDGVFNAVPEKDIAAIVQQNEDVQQAAAALEKRVLSAGNPHQDNFTAVIIGL